MFMHKNRQITFADKPNRHALIWGNSGYGKSFCCYRIIENEYDMKHRILVVDYSGSYDEYEIRKAGLKIPYIMWNPYHKPFYWYITIASQTEFISKLSDILVVVLNITSYVQRKLLSEAIEMYVEKSYEFTFNGFYHTLELLYETKKGDESCVDELANLERLLTRFFPYRNVNTIHIKPEKDSNKPCLSRLCILQLSEFPENLRKFLTLVFAELVWLESKNRNRRNRFDTVLFDEFQFMPIKPGSALAHFLREGRKLEVGVILSTQFISTYTQEELETLLQVGNLLIFHPNDRELKFSAKILDYEHPNLWIPLLKKLSIGQAILKGNYTINDNIQLLRDPIICNIADDGGDTSV